MTNLGKYNEGQLVYERVAFPTDTETVQAALKKIGIDGIRYEEIFISDYDGPMPQLHKHLGEYESIDELNHLACLLSELSQDELAVFEAVMDSGEYTGSVKDLINLSQNLDSYSFYSDVHTEEDLGRMYLQELEAVPVPEHLIDYIDYEAYGRDARINEDGHLAPGGYVVGGGSSSCLWNTRAGRSATETGWASGCGARIGSCTQAGKMRGLPRRVFEPPSRAAWRTSKPVTGPPSFTGHRTSPSKNIRNIPGSWQ